VATRVLHHLLDVVASLADDVGVLCVGHVHLKGYPVTLLGKGRRRRHSS
jgi:ABC-type glutathione transport system ATPase component